MKCPNCNYDIPTDSSECLLCRFAIAGAAPQPAQAEPAGSKPPKPASPPLQEEPPAPAPEVQEPPSEPAPAAKTAPAVETDRAPAAEVKPPEAAPPPPDQPSYVAEDPRYAFPGAAPAEDRDFDPVSAPFPDLTVKASTSALPPQAPAPPPPTNYTIETPVAPPPPPPPAPTPASQPAPTTSTARPNWLLLPIVIALVAWRAYAWLAPSKLPVLERKTLPAAPSVQAAPPPSQAPSPVVLPPTQTAPALPPPTAPTEPPPPRPWVFEGLAYDLISLRPVFDAEMVFISSAAVEDFQVRTDENGRFKVSLPPAEGGYRLAVRHIDYQDKYFDEIDPPYRRHEIAERRALLRATSTHRPWVGRAGRRTKRDVVFFPQMTVEDKTVEP